MKKLLCLLMITSLLCGCTGKTYESSIITEESSEVIVCEDLDTSVRFVAEEEFLESVFCKDLRAMGSNIYSFQYDTERYSLSMISADASFYVYHLYDNVEEVGVRSEMLYDPTVSTMDEVQAIFGNEKSVMTKAEKDGIEYDVFLSTSQYGEETDYSLIYMPFANYRVSIHADNNQTIDEILEYFDDFELVEVQEE